MPLEIGEVPGGGRPWGGIVQVETPNLDRVTQQLQQSYADRRAYLQKENQNTEEVLNKEMANVRSVDTPGIIDAYNDYKNSKQNQLFNKGIQNNPKAYATAQMDANAKYANLMSMINKSSQYNAFGKQIATNRLAKPDNYSDDAGDMLSTFYQTPMDKLTAATYKGKPIDLTNADSWRNPIGNVDLTKTYDGARGKPVTHYDDGTTDESGVQTTQHGYSYGNTPLQFRNAALPGLAGSQAGRRARYDWAQHSDDQQHLDQLDAAYQNSPNWQKLGVQPQALPPYNPNDPIGNEATYQAKQYLVSMNPAEVQAKAVVDRGALQNLTAKNRLHGQEVMAGINEGNAETRIKLQHQYKQLDASAQSQVLDETVDGMVQKAIAGGPIKYVSADGAVSKQYEIPTSPGLQKILSVPDDKGHPIFPSSIRFDPVNKTVTPLYFKPDQTGNMRAVDGTLSKPMTFGEFKAVVGKQYFGTREAAKEATPKPTAKTGGSGIQWQP